MALFQPDWVAEGEGVGTLGSGEVILVAPLLFDYIGDRMSDIYGALADAVRFAGAGVVYCCWCVDVIIIYLMHEQDMIAVLLLAFTKHCDDVAGQNFVEVTFFTISFIMKYFCAYVLCRSINAE